MEQIERALEETQAESTAGDLFVRATTELQDGDLNTSDSRHRHFDIAERNDYEKAAEDFADAKRSESRAGKLRTRAFKDRVEANQLDKRAGQLETRADLDRLDGSRHLDSAARRRHRFDDRSRSHSRSRSRSRSQTKRLEKAFDEFAEADRFESRAKGLHRRADFDRLDGVRNIRRGVRGLKPSRIAEAVDDFDEANRLDRRAGSLESRAARDRADGRRNLQKARGRHHKSAHSSHKKHRHF